MRSPIQTLRFVPIICILATFPASGQVENATDDRFAQTTSLDAAGASASLAPADSAGIAPPEIRAPRLAVDAAVLHTARPVGQITQAPRTVLSSPVVQPTPYDRIAALSAVPLTQPPPPHAEQPKAGAMTEALATATTWAGIAQDYFTTHWREVGLIAAMVILSGLLFWRLGERSRHADQELVLDLDVMPLVGEAVEQTEDDPMGPAQIDQLAQIEPEIDPEGLPLPVPAAALPEEPMPEEPALEEAVPARHFGTLREAIEAMKAEQNTVSA